MPKPNAKAYPRHRGLSCRERAWRGVIALAAGCLAAAVPATAQADKPLAMQTPEAWSVGTSTNLQAASQTLLQKFDEISKGSRQITANALFGALRPQPAEQRDASQIAIRFFLASPIARRLAGEGAGTGMTRSGLAHAATAATDPKLDTLLLSWGDPKNRGSRRFDMALLRDPGVPDAVRKSLLTHFSDEQLLQMIGRPNVQGSERDKHDETTAFVFLIRLSWLGAAEAAAIARYRVPYVMTRGNDDKGASYWNGHNVQLSEVMLAGQRGGSVEPKELIKHIGTFAHESGHALYALSGTQKGFEADMARRGVTSTPGTRGLNGIVNEGMAGVFQNRAGVAAQGYGTHKDTDDHLSIDNDIENNLADDKRMYAKYYHVDTRAARAELPMVRQLVANDLIPWFETEFDLLDDPQLTLKLPPPRPGVP